MKLWVSIIFLSKKKKKKRTPKHFIRGVEYRVEIILSSIQCPELQNFSLRADWPCHDNTLWDLGSAAFTDGGLSLGG